MTAGSLGGLFLVVSFAPCRRRALHASGARACSYWAWSFVPPTDRFGRAVKGLKLAMRTAGPLRLGPLRLAICADARGTGLRVVPPPVTG